MSCDLLVGVSCDLPVGVSCDLPVEVSCDLPGHVFQREGYGVLGHHSFSCRGVSRHKHTLVVLEVENGLFLEHIQLKRILKQKHNRRVLSPILCQRLVYNAVTNKFSNLDAFS